MRRFNIGTRILLVFSLLLLFSFSLIGGIFNSTALRYIRNSAIAQLDELYSSMQELITLANETGQSFLDLPLGDSIPRFTAMGNVFRIQSKIFLLDSEYNLYENQNNAEISDDILELIQTLKYNGVPLDALHNERVMTTHGVYYLSGLLIPEMPNDDQVYLIISADVSGLTSFAGTINFFLVISVIITFLISVVVTLLLSISITRPISKLSELALNIGRGDFTPKDFKFKDTEFVDLNTSLNKSAKQLGIYDSEQKMFFQNVSHELRTPLMSIKCYAEGISFGLMEPQKASATILQETDRLTEMVQNLLYISKLDNITTTYTVEKVDIEEIIRTCAQHQIAIADKHHLHFSFDFDAFPIYLEGIGELLSRAVDNLISNAIRYASSEIILSCHRTAHTVVISVEDDGPGIEDEAMPHLFERFYKGPGGNQGIGLSLVKSIAEQHNGRVDAANASKGGAVFTMTLPATTWERHTSGIYSGK